MDRSGVAFTNRLTYTEEVNPYTFKNFYNGGGVGIGDINNDGLEDIFFCGNQVSNRLYLNKGDFAFEDVSETSGLATDGTWSTGVSLVDINADGLLDIYVCKSGPPDGINRKNSLYINNGDLTFTDQAPKYGLDHFGLSSHAAFFDFDLDGDLDCYLLNNSIRSVGAYDYVQGLRDIPDTLGGNKLLRNDDGFFVDASAEAGIYHSAIGFGLGVTIADINLDSWPDIYVSNDFFERDYLYINNSDGTFRELLTRNISEISMGSMGADIADLTNDGHPEIFVTEMLPDRHDRLMSKAQFENWDKYRLSVKNEYHHQFGRNVLQLNNGNGTFSEIGRLSGLDATDWSWGALFFDMDNDGLKDVFVANGIYKDLLDQDYINFTADPEVIRKMINEEEDAIKSLVDLIPSEPLPNFAFKNLGQGVFRSVGLNWGFSIPSFSNGSAYGDLDNDGDLDLVLNNFNQPASIYRNNSEELNHHFLKVQLKGLGKNTQAVGSRVIVYLQGEILAQELNPMRGFQSSTGYQLVFGLGQHSSIDSLEVVWPTSNGSISTLRKVPVDTVLILDQGTAKKSRSEKDSIRSIFKELGNDFFDKHNESPFVDFDKDRLLFEMHSDIGPCACIGDLNEDGLQDLFIGSSRGSSSHVWIQSENGLFEKRNIDIDNEKENVSCQMVDLNGDGHLDLFVGNGSSEFSGFSLGLKDDLLLGDGSGNLKATTSLFLNSRLISTNVISAADYNGDGVNSIFVGAGQVPGEYGRLATSYLLEGTLDNQNNNYQELADLGMVNDAVWGDLTGDGSPDLLVVGDWMSPKLFYQDQGALILDTIRFQGLSGLYQCVELNDFDQDGDLDIFLGNKGLNTRYQATIDQPLTMVLADLDQNGKQEHLIGQYEDDVLYPIVQMKDLLMQVPVLRKKFVKFEDYKYSTFDDIVAGYEGEMTRLQVSELASIVLRNKGGGEFERIELPTMAQISPIYAMHFVDVNGDGYDDLITGGNKSRVKPEWGMNMGSYGQLFINQNGAGFEYITSKSSGINCEGEVREILSYDFKGKRRVIFIRNGDRPYFMELR